MVWLVLFGLGTGLWVRNRFPFSDARTLGHELREILTHGTVTIPLTLGCLAVLSRRLGLKGEKAGLSSSGCRTGGGFLAFATACIIPVWILFQLRGRDVLAAAQKQSTIADLLASHYFEHSLDYLLTISAACALYAVILSRTEGNRA